MTSILIGITIILAAPYCSLRRSSAALRHTVWTCAILATLLFAPLRWIAPQRSLSGALPVILTPPVNVSGVGAGHDFNIIGIAIALWITGSLFVALRLIFSTVRLRRIVRDSRSIGGGVFTSSRIPGPVVAGILRPVILIPETSSSWTPARRRAVLAHELAHVRRHDPLIFLMAHVATIVYWFHPLCWLAASRLRAESELACDDAALRVGLLPSGYAEHLLDLARNFNPQPAIAMAATSHLESRVKSILDPAVNRSFAARRNWLVASLITAAVIAPLAIFNLQAQDAPTRVRVGGNVQSAKIISQPKPTYPPEMKAQRLEETVVLDAVISKEGVPLSLSSQNGARPEFVKSAVDAVMQWRYEPTLLNGQAVEVETTITVNYTLSR
jgi:TonB family protein